MWTVYPDTSQDEDINNGMIAGDKRDRQRETDREKVRD